LLDQLECQALFAADPESPYALTVQEARPMPKYQVPTVDALLSVDFPRYPCSKLFDELKDSPLVILHTSGTTATPKPITYTNDWAASYTQMLKSELGSPDSTWRMKDSHLRNVRLMVMMPPFHAANLFLALFIPFANQTTVVFPPANQPPTVEVFIGAIKSIRVDSAFVAPHLISHIATNSEYMDITAQRVETLISGGGKIVEAHGNLVSSRMRLMTLYGATEVGSVPDIMFTAPQQRGMWNYMRPHPNAGWQFRLHDENETGVFYEAWITRSRDLPIEQPVFKIFREQTEYSTRDLFTPHPAIPGIWKWYGRIDDTICLCTGANVSPNKMETGISNVAGVQGVLMLGNECLRPVLLVEPVIPCETLDAKRDLLARVWAAVEDLNPYYYEDHRILKNYVLLTDTRKPMVRSLKGSIQRRATASLYGAELKRLFL
jgi:acyl-coenzyme A synthetase/AMP-(fatty) acid ligase